MDVDPDSEETGGPTGRRVSRVIKDKICVAVAAVNLGIRSPVRRSAAKVKKTLAASDAADNDRFGWTVAMSASGSIVVVGAPDVDELGVSTGKVYVYSGADWGTETPIFASVPVVADHFGGDVGISADGSVIVVGNRSEASGISHAWVYSGSNWGTETVLTASDDEGPLNRFGRSVSVSADGSVVAVRCNGLSTGGKVYVYSGSDWATETVILPSDEHALANFGSSVSVSSDGSIIAVGAEQQFTPLVSTGKAYVYSGASWGTETALLPAGLVSSSYFGASVEISDDGSVVIVGAYQQSEDGHVGRAYVFSGANWATVTVLDAADVGDGGGSDFGNAVDISGNGLVAVVAHIGYDGDSGNAYAFRGPNWSTRKRLLPADLQANDRYGRSVALSLNGSFVGIGASEKNDSRGKVYLWKI